MWITIYTDASTKDGVSAGSYWIKSNHTRIKESIKLFADNSHLAEFEIARKAIERAIVAHVDHTITGILLISDNMDVVHRYKFNAVKANNKHIRVNQTLVADLLKQNDIRIRTKHQKGHSKEKTVGAWINNHIDKKAKQKREE